MPRRALRLLHTSDVHLGSHGYHGAATHHRHCVCPLRSLAKVAADNGVDGVLVVGDLFDHARVDELLVRRAFEVLDAMPGFTALIVGNHDVHDDTSPYRRHETVVTSSETLFLDQLHGAVGHPLDGELVLWGRAMDEHSHRYRPLHGVVERPLPDAWYVVLGHGLHIGEDSIDGAGRSSLITSADIAATRADYVALGHHHVRTDVSAGGVTAYYSGAPSGYPGGEALVVDLHPERGVQVTAVPVEPFDACVD